MSLGNTGANVKLPPNTYRGKLSRFYKKGTLNCLLINPKVVCSLKGHDGR
jgi:hypothetical protein